MGPHLAPPGPHCVLPPRQVFRAAGRPGSRGKTVQIVSRVLFPGSQPGPHSLCLSVISKKARRHLGPEPTGGSPAPVAGGHLGATSTCGFVQHQRQSEVPAAGRGLPPTHGSTQGRGVLSHTGGVSDPVGSGSFPEVAGPCCRWPKESGQGVCRGGQYQGPRCVSAIQGDVSIDHQELFQKAHEDPNPKGRLPSLRGDFFRRDKMEEGTLVTPPPGDSSPRKGSERYFGAERRKPVLWNLTLEDTGEQTWVCCWESRT